MHMCETWTYLRSMLINKIQFNEKTINICDINLTINTVNTIEISRNMDHIQIFTFLVSWILELIIMFAISPITKI